MRRSALLALSVLGLAGCGHIATVGRARTLEIGMTEYRLVPDRVQAHAGTLAILAHNGGRLTHNLVVTSSGQPLGVTKPIAPGQSRWLTLVLAPGHYVMASNLFSDQALGISGTLTVTP